MLAITTTSELLVILLGCLALYNYQSLDRSPPDTPTSSLQQEYDFIVVGAGSAGSVVASRLSEVEGWKVLLLESGTDDTLTTRVPLLFPNLMEAAGLEEQLPPLSPRIVFHKTEPQKRACRGNNGKCVLPRAYVLGGCSAINAMVYTRGNRADYDAWARMGNEGWSYQDVLPYFLKSEDQRDPHLYNDTRFHSRGGLLGVSTTDQPSPLSDAFLEAVREVGYPAPVDVNGENQNGFTRYQATTADGVRSSTAKAFLTPAKNRTNLHLALRSTVTRVVIDPATKRALGVEFTRDGQKVTALAKREVVLSAGALQSPRLLMNSGVGPSDVLKNAGIPPIVHSPGVGANLQDHLGIFLIFVTNATGSDIVDYRSVEEYAKNGTGPLSYFGIDSFGFVDSTGAGGLPNVELIFVGRFGIALKPGPRMWASFTGMTQSKSKGRVTLDAIDPNYFSSEDDYQSLLAGVKETLKISRAPALQRHDSKLDRTQYPLCTGPEDEAFFRCLVENYSTTMHHLAGSAKMGPEGDPESVVDSRLRVRRVQGLRVVDAAVMPSVPRGNINAPVIMLAEKGAHMIKQDNLQH